MEDMKMPMCSICEVDLEYDEFMFEDCDGDTVWFKSRGYCPECGKEYRWYDRYTFSGICDLKCVSEPDIPKLDFCEDV